MRTRRFVLLTISIIFYVSRVVSGDLSVGFYNSTCPKAETIVRQVVQKQLANDRSLTPALLRMHFHDCFVRGCDASILIDSTSSNPSEKTAGPNLSVRGFETIDEVKKVLETQCPSTVSCADIIALAARDAVALAGGPNYPVPTGRRDGVISNPNDVNLPGPTFSVSMAIQSFKAKNLSLNDMVTLLGAHTVGAAHCSLFSDRLTNFQGTEKPDPSMDTSLVNSLKTICKNQNVDPSAFLDQNTSFVFDNQFYNQIVAKRGVLQLDQAIANDASSRGIVSGFATSNEAFKKSFGEAMVKMGSIDVLVGNKGTIRKNCRVFNGKGQPKKNKQPEKAKKPKTKHRKTKSKDKPKSPN